MGLFLNLEKICSFSEGAMGVGYIGYENSGTFFRFDEFFSLFDTLCGPAVFLM